MTPSGPSFFILGGIALHGAPDGQVNSLLAQSKVVALLAYLVLSAPETFQRRDRIVGLLWPELDQHHARAALRKAVYLARAALGEQSLIGRGDEELAVAPGALWCDAAELRGAVERGYLARAIDLYRGDLMPGFHLPECQDFDAWLEDRRAELQEEATAACWALARHLESQGKDTQAGRYARKAARLAWDNERVLRRSLVMLDRLGDRAGALQLYQEFVRRLRRELEADPSPETVRLTVALREGRPPI